MFKSILSLTPIAIFVLVSTAHSESSSDRNNKYGESVFKAASAQMESLFSRDTDYWASVNFIAFDNGQKIRVEKYELDEKSLSISKSSSGKLLAHIKGRIVFSQSEKTSGLPISLYFDVKGDEIHLTNFNYPGERNPPKNPNYEKNLVLTSDPIAEFRGNKKVVKAINKRTAFIGMPEGALLAAYPPMSVNESESAHGTVKQYVDDFGYFYVENGKVKAIQRHQSSHY